MPFCSAFGMGVGVRDRLICADTRWMKRSLVYITSSLRCLGGRKHPRPSSTKVSLESRGSHGTWGFPDACIGVVISKEPCWTSHNLAL